jgi:hypothetical protein
LRAAREANTGRTALIAHLAVRACLCAPHARSVPWQSNAAILDDPSEFKKSTIAWLGCVRDATADTYAPLEPHASLLLDALREHTER